MMLETAALVKSFQHELFGNIRVVKVNGEPWFVAADVCRALELGNVTQTLSYLDDDERGDFIINDVTGRPQGMLIISESGLYSLVLRSRKPIAKSFKRWVTHDILVPYRKHGAVISEQRIEEILTDPDTLIRLATDLKAERAQRVQAEQKAIELSAQVQASLPKVLFADSVSAASTGINVGELAKILNQNGVDTGQNRLFQQLHEHGFVMRRNGQWVPTQKSMDLGLMRVKETVISPPDREPITSLTVKVTGKGQLYFVEYFLNKKAA